MKEKDRQLMRRRLDVEMRPFRRGAVAKHPTEGLLKAVRLALRIPSEEIAQRMGIRRSNVFYLEERERKGTIGFRALSRAAKAMGCEVVYGIVPKGGKTMEALYEESLWAAVLGVPQLNKREREGVVNAVLRQVKQADKGQGEDGMAA